MARVLTVTGSVAGERGARKWDGRRSDTTTRVLRDGLDREDQPAEKCRQRGHSVGRKPMSRGPGVSIASQIMHLGCHFISKHSCFLSLS